MQLTKLQRNMLLETVVNEGLNALEFDLGQMTYAVQVVHQPTRSYINIGEEFSEKDKGHFQIKMRVGRDPEYIRYTNDWENVLGWLGNWAKSLKNDLETPDLWDELHRRREFLSQAGRGAIVATPFTIAEQAEIAAQLRAIKNYVRKNLALSTDQLSDIEARLDEAEAAASRVNRKDWLLLFLGVMFTLIITGVLPPEVVQHIFEMALHGISHLFGLGKRPLGLPSII